MTGERAGDGGWWGWGWPALGEDLHQGMVLEYQGLHALRFARKERAAFLWSLRLTPTPFL
jgi:hypothetical protein